MIRPAQPSDAGGILAIWNPIIRDTTITFTTREKTPEDIDALIRNHPVWVAEQGRQVAGFLTWAQFRGGPGYADSYEHSIHIAEAARGAGIGRALMAHGFDQIRAQGGHILVAGLSGENTSGQAFHCALGFEAVAHMPKIGKKFGRRLDLVLMQKFL